MPWLLVGVQHNEIDFFPYGQYHNIDFHDADHIGDIFSSNLWYNVLQSYGSEYFDVILTDGGLMNIKRDDEIVKIKHKLLKSTGYILNYTSVIGDKVQDPLGRHDVFFYKIHKKDYTIENFDRVWDTIPIKTWSDRLKTTLRLII